MVNVIKNIVVPGKPAVANGSAVPPFRQIHLHSTGNPNATNANSISYLSREWGNAYYTHIVGEGKAIQVAATNGGAWDVGGDWNLETFAAIEFNEHVANQAEFNRDYKIYIALARQLAKEAGIKDFTLDTPGTIGIKTHNYASATGHGSDHVDPLPFLAKWGVSYDKLKHDVKYGLGSEPTTPSKQPSSKPAPKHSSAIQQFKNAGNAFTATKPFTLDKIAFVNGIWQGISFKLAGSKSDWDWTLNAIPLAILDNKTRGNQADSHEGDKFTFMKGYNEGTIDEYDQKSNGVGIIMGGYGMIWFDANALLDL